MTEPADDPTAQVDPEQVLRFRGGIPGFPQCEHFVLVELAEDSVFQLLQSLDEPDVSMVVGIPWLFFPDYEMELSDVEQEELGLANPEDAIVFCPVTLDAENSQVFVNLLGPFVVNAHTREGRQVVLTDSDLPVRAPVALA